MPHRFTNAMRTTHSNDVGGYPALGLLRNVAVGEVLHRVTQSLLVSVLHSRHLHARVLGRAVRTRLQHAGQLTARRKTDYRKGVRAITCW